MKIQKPTTQISELFKALSQPARIEILLAIGSGEACVCHLEAVLKMRQAYISQHLMALRQASILETRRDGRYIYYSLTDPALMGLIRLAAEALDIPARKIVFASGGGPSTECGCPDCETSPPSSLAQLKV
jgi:DNA-binding transcriptional ArsR family regulator